MVASTLEREGFAVWWDAAIHSGESFDMVIESKLAEAKAVVVLWSPSSVRSRWVRAEAASADRDGKLAPVIIEPCTRPIIFEMLHTVDLSHWNGDGADPIWGQFLLDLHRSIRVQRQEGSQAKAEERPPAQFSAPTPPPEPASNAPFMVPAAEAEVDEEENYEATQFFVAASQPAVPEHFLYLVVDGRTEKQYPVMDEGIRIGRSAPAEVILSDKQVSRRHCRVELKGEDLVVTDLGSTNGTYVDDEKIVDSTVLPVGSTLKVGQCELIHEKARASA